MARAVAQTGGWSFRAVQVRQVDCHGDEIRISHGSRFVVIAMANGISMGKGVSIEDVQPVRVPLPCYVRGPDSSVRLATLRSLTVIRPQLGFGLGLGLGLAASIRASAAIVVWLADRGRQVPCRSWCTDIRPSAPGTRCLLRPAARGSGNRCGIAAQTTPLGRLWPGGSLRTARRIDGHRWYRLLRWPHVQVHQVLTPSGSPSRRTMCCGAADRTHRAWARRNRHRHRRVCDDRPERHSLAGVDWFSRCRSPVASDHA
jgi:hypothetical protein